MFKSSSKGKVLNWAFPSFGSGVYSSRCCLLKTCSDLGAVHHREVKGSQVYFKANEFNSKTEHEEMLLPSSGHLEGRSLCPMSKEHVLGYFRLWNIMVRPIHKFKLGMRLRVSCINNAKWQVSAVTWALSGRILRLQIQSFSRRVWFGFLICCFLKYLVTIHIIRRF